MEDCTNIRAKPSNLFVQSVDNVYNSLVFESPAFVCLEQSERGINDTRSTCSRKILTSDEYPPNAIGEDMTIRRTPSLTLHQTRPQHDEQFHSKNDDEIDYDEAWTSSSLMHSNVRNISCADGRYRIQSSTTETGPLNNVYGEAIGLNAVMNWRRLHEKRDSTLFYANMEMISLSSDLIDVDCESRGNIALYKHQVNTFNTQLPKNALLQYFGKVSLKPTEMSDVDLTRSLSELTDLSQIIRAKCFFVLLRILDDTMVLEGRIRSTDKPTSAYEHKYARGKKKLPDKIKSPKNSPSRQLYRKQSNSGIRSSNILKEQRPSVIDLQESDTEVNMHHLSGNLAKTTTRRSRLCMDIFLCMGRNNRTTKQVSASSETVPTKPYTSIPVKGNTIIDSFDLRRIAYCGTEYTAKIGAHLLVWLYSIMDGDESVCCLECHATACDDFQHAKYLATSLGEAIRKAVSKAKE